MPHPIDTITLVFDLLFSGVQAVNPLLGWDQSHFNVRIVSQYCQKYGHPITMGRGSEIIVTRVETTDKGLRAGPQVQGLPPMGGGAKPGPGRIGSGFKVGIVHCPMYLCQAFTTGITKKEFRGWH